MSTASTITDALDDDAEGLGSLSGLQPETDWLRADFGSFAGPGTAVDRQAGVIRGYIVAEKGRFKSGRGEFDDAALNSIVQLGNENPNGLKSRWTHPSLSGDGLGNFLGRNKNYRRDGDKVRADLHFNRTALETPAGGGKSRGHYLMDLAETDPTAFGSSLALKADKELRLDSSGVPLKDDKGKALPKLWRPTKLHASDIVDDGDACHTGFLSADANSLPDGVVRQASELLNKQFAGCDRSTVLARGTAWLSRYLDLRFGPDEGDAMSTEVVPPVVAAVVPAAIPPVVPATPATLAKPDELNAKLDELLATRFAKEREQLAAEREADRKEREAMRAETLKTAAVAKQARIDDFLKSRAAKIASWELDESTPKAARLSLRTRMLQLSTELTIPVPGADGKDVLLSALDIEMEAIDARPNRPHGERLSSFTVTDERTDQKKRIAEFHKKQAVKAK